MQALAAALLETAMAWEQAGQAHEDVRESMGAVDETCLEQMRLVGRDLRPGSLLLAAVADDRTYATWPAGGEERLQALGAHGLSLGSDRAKALVQRADTGWACLSRPDVFPVVHDSVKRSSRPIGQRVRQARPALTQAQEALARRPGQRHAAQEVSEAQALVEARQAAVGRGEEAHHTSRGPFESLAHTLPPVHLSHATPPTAAQVARPRTAAVEGLAA